MAEKLFYVGVKAMIEDEQGKILLFLADTTKHHKIKTDPYWDLPGGRIEEGETVIDALKREVFEETGVTFTSTPEFFTSVVSHHQVPIDDTRNAGLVLMIYRVKIPVDSKLVLSDEHTKCEWMSPADAAKQLSHKYPKEFTEQL